MTNILNIQLERVLNKSSEVFSEIGFGKRWIQNLFIGWLEDK